MMEEDDGEASRLSSQHKDISAEELKSLQATQDVWKVAETKSGLLYTIDGYHRDVI